MTLDWQAIPPATTGRADQNHPFARDLDLTGEYSIHRLLDTAVSREGSDRLRTWLLDQQPDLTTIQTRQARVRVLTSLTYFRDKLTLSGTLASTGAAGWWHGDRLLAWLAQDNQPQRLRPLLLGAALLAVTNIILVVLNSLGQLPNYWIVTTVLYVALLLFTWREVAGLFENALTLQNGLRRIEAVFRHLEAFPLSRYESLRTLCAPFIEPKGRPSASLKRIGRLVIGIGLTQNPFIGTVLNLILPWNLFFAHRLRRYKADLAGDLPGWLDIWFELEALSSLATFAYLNPDYHFPEIEPPTATQNGRGSPIFEAEGLGHPLIPAGQKVRNDFSFEHLGEMGIITGSNMAGKSSFLRTMGVNLRLAFVGGPVDAVAWRSTLFRLFTSLAVSDSVTDGISFFYAEVKRLKALLNALEQADGLALLFLIDEIFRGTNNRERFIGSRSYLRALIGRRGVGLVATHDLELVRLADEFPQIRNYHFRETVEEGRMIFDYQLQSGPCPTTNALKIMQMEGLPVEDTNEAAESDSMGQ
jgi:hypothetical protein